MAVMPGLVIAVAGWQIVPKLAFFSNVATLWLLTCYATNHQPHLNGPPALYHELNFGAKASC